MTLLCQTVTGRTMAELIANRDAAQAADMVELRLDGVDRPDVAAALSARRMPVLVTCRSAWEGGRFDGAEEERRAILRQALELGADYVDVEFRAGFSDLIAADPSRVVLSSHDFTGVPKDLAEQARAMRQAGAGIIKIAVTASALSDTLPLVDIARDGKAVVLAMGDAGVPSRLLASRFGSLWSCCGDGLVPELTAAQMIDEFRFRDVGPETAIYGIVGSTAMYSLSPVMHNAAFRAAGLDAVYVPLRAKDFDDFLSFAAALGINGASITIPFKLDALRAAATTTELTSAVGAANTFRRRGSEWEATNTDVDGFLDPLDAAYGAPLEGARAVVLGAGGAARAVAVALRSRGTAVTVHARRESQARDVADLVGAQVGEWPPHPASWDVLVNCTPLGGSSFPDESPLPDGPFEGRVVYDLNYGKREAPLLRAAREAGCTTLDGLPMLIAQAGRQFQWWTGAAPADGVMRNALQRKVGGHPR